jgi:hypothetical protein
MSRVHKVLVAELEGGRFRTRTELAAALAKRGIDARGPRLGLLTIHAELEQVMCSGPVRGKQLTYALFDERAPRAKAHTPRDSGAELASRYFASHGPATLRDFVWWSGLTVAQAKKGVEHAGLEPREAGGLTYWAADWDVVARMPPATFLLPNYDEYLIAYKDRGLLLPPGPAPRGGIAGLNAYAHPLVVDGVLAGYWTRRVSRDSTRIELKPWKPLGATAARAVKAATARLMEFAGDGTRLMA